MTSSLIKAQLPWLLLTAVTLGWYLDTASPPPPTAEVRVEAVAVEAGAAPVSTPEGAGSCAATPEDAAATFETYGMKPGIVLSVKSNIQRYVRTLLRDIRKGLRAVRKELLELREDLRRFLASAFPERHRVWSLPYARFNQTL
jgi:hypothetical protein